VDVVGLSFLGGSHLAYCEEIATGLVANGLAQVGLIVGGVIPDKDIETLKKVGVHAVFTPNTDTRDILAFLDEFAVAAAASAAAVAAAG
jgi:methylmalonyl-CoA mutase cobalamin-binding domain/chain